MTSKTEAIALADAFESVRTLTKWYLSKMKEVDMHKVFEMDGLKFNSAYWITAHLVWSEHYILLVGMGGKPMDIPWLDQFGLGSKFPDDFNSLPPVKEVLGAWKEVHAAAMKQLRSLPDELLDKENPTGFGFGGDNSYRMMIQHAIRHEAIHAGHLSWLCKMYKIKTI